MQCDGAVNTLTVVRDLDFTNCTDKWCFLYKTVYANVEFVFSANAVFQKSS